MAKLPEEKQNIANASKLSHKSVTVTRGVRVEATRYEASLGTPSLIVINQQ
jgi:hypothetical protein